MPEQESSQEICKHCGQPVTVHTSETCSLLAVQKEYEERYKPIHDVQKRDRYEEKLEHGDLGSHITEIEQKFRQITQDSKKISADKDKSKETIIEEAIERLRKLSDSSPTKDLLVKEESSPDSETIESILIQASFAVQITSNYFIELYKIESKFKDNRKAEYERLKSNYLEFTEIMQKAWKDGTLNGMKEKTEGKVYDQIKTIRIKWLHLQGEVGIFVEQWLGELKK